MATHQELFHNPAFMADLQDFSISSRAVAAKWGVGKTFINKYRNKPQNVITSDNTDGPAWPVIQQARPLNIVPMARFPEDQALEWKTAIILPDPQIGFRRFDDGTLDPFHDTKAMAVAIQIIEYEQSVNGVEQVVNLGDFLDLPSQGRFAQEATFANTTQLAID